MDVFRNYLDSHDNKVRNEVSIFSLTTLVTGNRLIVQNTEVIPELKKGNWVICDRYAFSGITCCDNQIMKDLVNEFLEPDIVFLANADSQTIKKRVKSRDDEKANFYNDDDVNKKIKIYKQMAEQHEFFVTINTEIDYKLMIDYVKKELGKIL